MKKEEIIKLKNGDLITIHLGNSGRIRILEYNKERIKDNYYYDLGLDINFEEISKTKQKDFEQLVKQEEERHFHKLMIINELRLKYTAKLVDKRLGIRI